MTLDEIASYAFQIFAALGGAGIFVQLVFNDDLAVIRPQEEPEND